MSPGEPPLCGVEVKDEVGDSERAGGKLGDI